MLWAAISVLKWRIQGRDRWGVGVGRQVPRSQRWATFHGGSLAGH